MGCAERKEPAPAPVPEAAAATPAEDDAGWRYAKELATASEGVARSPVLELSMGDRGRALVLAAVQRPGSPLPAVTLEVWTFEQRGEDLAPVGDPRVAATLGLEREGAPDGKAVLDELRRARAAPGTVVQRPSGLKVRSASEAFAAIVRDAKATVDPSATAQARVDAASSLLRGIDDGVAFAGRLGQLVTTLAAIDPAAATVDPQSERRVRVTAGEQTFEVWKTGSGWTLARF